MKYPSVTQQISLTWLRRDLRLHDHAAFHAAQRLRQPTIPVFIFDTDILSHFSSRNDRRLSFITHALWKIHTDLGAVNSGVLLLHGRAQEIIPRLAALLNASHVFAAEDYEPATRQRDTEVQALLQRQGRVFHTVCDHVVLPPDAVRKADGQPYLVFTPYSKAWRNALTTAHIAEREVTLSAGQFVDYASIETIAKHAGLPVLSWAEGVGGVLRRVGYAEQRLNDWPVNDGRRRLACFMRSSIARYAVQRDVLDGQGTSGLSPYFRHGLLSVREAMRLAVEQQQSDVWANELIWREFYMMILYYFPETVRLEWQVKYRGMQWWGDKANWPRFAAGKTGYPVVDAAMRQLHATGWMHNRARMIVASFLTKDLLLDWRLGEGHFANWLMDFEQSSNVGGWQWAASTGTDAAPYFRIFNPVTQSRRYDANGDYIRRWLPELAHLDARHIHFPPASLRPKDYPPPLVDHAESRKLALQMYREQVVKERDRQ